MYDLHAHILPGVDDGARTPNEAMEMARVAAEHGTQVILATPHRKDVSENWSVSDLRDLLDEMNSLILGRGLELDLRLGMENHLDLDLPDEVSKGRALPMNDSRYILVEAPFFGRPNYMEDVLFQLQLQGLTPVVAHPERIEAFQRDIQLLERFVERGMLTQITAGSVIGYFGGRVRRFTHRLLRQGLVHVIASDTHFPDGYRSPKLPPGVAAAAGVVAPERVRTMVVDTPKAILANLPIEVPPPQRPAKRRRWWRLGRRG